MGRARGRPRQYDPEQALDAAMSVFWERGFSATSLTDLGEAMGMNRPSLYAAFGDKRALYLQALGRFELRMRAELGGALTKHADLHRGLTEFYFAAIDLYLSGEGGARGCMVASTAGIPAVHDEEVREFVRNTISRLDSLLSARMTEAAESGQLDESAGGRGPLAAAVLHSLSVRARAGCSRRVLRRFARDSVELLLGRAHSG